MSNKYKMHEERSFFFYNLAQSHGQIENLLLSKAVHQAVSFNISKSPFNYRYK